MRITLEIDDGLLARAQTLTQLGEPSAVIHRALRALIERESARHMALLRGTEPDLNLPPRRRSEKQNSAKNGLGAVAVDEPALAPARTDCINAGGSSGRGHADRSPVLSQKTCALTLMCKSKEVEVRITSKGQVTIPAEIRERAGLLPHTEVEFEFDGKAVRIFRAKAQDANSRGARLVAHLRGRGDVAMSTDEIMALTRED
jgi:AbrB family looped-hinge helix DNA binding protein